MLLAVVVRALVGLDWILVTADSPSFVSLAFDFLRGDVSDPRLGTIRLPAYPAFLSLFPASGLGSPGAIVAAQSLLGIVSSVAAWWVARRLSSRRVALAVGAALALHPALIAFEHALMSETLALLLGLGSCVFLVRAVERRSAAESFVAGVLAAATLLTRLNLLPLVAVALALALRSERLDPDPEPRRRLGMRVAALAGLALCLVPWATLVWRSHGVPSIFGGGASLRLANAMEVGLVPPERMESEFGAPAPGVVSPASFYLREMATRGAEGNRIARRILGSALRERPAEFATAAARSALVAPGWYWQTANPLWREIPSWLEEGRMASNGQPSRARQRLAELLPRGDDVWTVAPATGWFGICSTSALVVARGALLTLAVIALLLSWPRPSGTERARQTLFAALLVYALLAILCGASFAMRERFADPLDGVAVAAGVAAIELLAGRFRGRAVMASEAATGDGASS
ncbi:MAG: glycosyltransferase family 39 protein [Thermoanaerobaculia bacterium]